MLYTLHINDMYAIDLICLLHFLKLQIPRIYLYNIVNGRIKLLWGVVWLCHIYLYSSIVGKWFAVMLSQQLYTICARKHLYATDRCCLPYHILLALFVHSIVLLFMFLFALSFDHKLSIHKEDHISCLYNLCLGAQTNTQLQM